MGIIAHTMEYCGDLIDEAIKLEQYSVDYYNDYKKIYEECFHEMRTALELKPVDCCDSQEELIQKQSDIFLLIENEELIGAVAIVKNEIDDLIVARAHQQKGYGKLILKSAIHVMQERGILPITLQVADWNKGAIHLYLNNGFKIVKTAIY